MSENIAKTTIEKSTLAAVARLCSTDKTRGPIGSVLVTATHVTATNGHALVQRRRYEKDKEQAAEILVPADLAKRAEKLGGKYLASVNLESTAGEVKTVVRAECAGEAAVNEHDGRKFPDTSCIINDATHRAADPAAVVRLAINPALLLEAALALGWEPATKGRFPKGVLLSIPLPVANGDGTVPEGVTAPLVMRLFADTGNGDVAIVMPVRW